ncbi:MAG: protease HtpX [Pseudomonadota bacterium]|nr:MAG: protease HtpX [Pseudomonadota bacterium]
MFKRITLFVITNLAVLLLLSFVSRVLIATGIIPPDFLGGYAPLLTMAAVLGFGGSLISLFMSKWMAKWTTGARVIETPRNATEAWLVETVRRQAQQVGIGMPEVAIYDSPEPNAFATGATKNNALVAVSTGLLQRMDRDEVEAVLGHEVSHVANGDMVTLTLIQGVLNTFVIFISRVVGGIVDSFLRRGEERGGIGIGYWVTVMVCEIVLGLLATLIVMWFSRYREYRADAGGATLAGRTKMINALRRLAGGGESELPKALTAFGIRGGGILGLFSSHPPIEERIRRLQQGAA